MKEREGEGDIIIKIDKCRIGDELGDGEKSRNISVDNNKEKKEKGRVKKSPKPPRPPGSRGLSLDAADQKLIKEISELLMIKRARIKALRKTKAPPTSSSTPNFIAMLFTLLFCLVILFQGCHSWGIERLRYWCFHFSKPE